MLRIFYIFSHIAWILIFCAILHFRISYKRIRIRNLLTSIIYLEIKIHPNYTFSRELYNCLNIKYRFNTFTKSSSIYQRNSSNLCY